MTLFMANIVISLEELDKHIDKFKKDMLGRNANMKK